MDRRLQEGGGAPGWTVEVVDAGGRRLALKHPVLDSVVAAILGHRHVFLAAADEAAPVGRERDGCRPDEAAPETSSAQLLTRRSDMLFCCGAWDQAQADADEAVRLALVGRDAVLARALACRSRIRAARGFDAGCRDDARRAVALADVTEEVAPRAKLAVALLLAGRNSPSAAADVLEQLAQGAGADDVPSPDADWRPELIEAYVRTRRGAAAERWLGRLRDEAQPERSTVAAVATARCEGLVATAGERDEVFSRAIRAAAACRLPFELARTELCWGERLRRDRRRAEARAPLTSAEKTFAALGASPWTERARRELEAATSRPSSQGSGGTALTSQEARVSGAVARGLSNPAIADELFLSRKTVEYHLGNVFRKLGVHSRTQLTRRLLQALPDAPEGTMEP